MHFIRSLVAKSAETKFVCSTDVPESQIKEVSIYLCILLESKNRRLGQHRRDIMNKDESKLVKFSILLG